MRLIDANALEFPSMKGKFCEVDLARIDGYHKAIEVIRRAPTIDAVPVVHSYWIGLALGPHPGIGHGICGNCHQRITLGDHKSRCPNCGAIMDLEVPEEYA